MRQRGFADMVTLVIYAGIFVVVAGTAYGAWHTVNTWCNGACEAARAETVTATARADTAEAKIVAAEAEATRVRLAWAADSVAAQSRAIQAEGERNARFTPIHNAARSLPAADARVRIPDSAVGVLDSAVAAANATLAGPAAEIAGQTATPPPDPAQPVDVAGLTAWGAQVAQQYAACADQVTGWQDWYQRLRDKQNAQHH